MYSYGNHFIEDILHQPRYVEGEFEYNQAPYYYGGSFHQPAHGHYHPYHESNKASPIDSGDISELSSSSFRKELMNIPSDDGTMTPFNSPMVKEDTSEQSGEGIHHLVHRGHPLHKYMMEHHGGNILLSLLPTLAGAVLPGIVDKIIDFIIPKQGSGIEDSELSDEDMVLLDIAEKSPVHFHKLLDIVEFLVKHHPDGKHFIVEHRGKGLSHAIKQLSHHHKSYGSGLFQSVHGGLFQSGIGGGIFKSGLGEHIHNKMKKRHHIHRYGRGHHMLHRIVPISNEPAGVSGDGIIGDFTKNIPIVGPLINLLGL